MDFRLWAVNLTLEQGLRGGGGFKEIIKKLLKFDS